MVAVLILLTIVGFLLVDWVVQVVHVRRGDAVVLGHEMAVDSQEVTASVPVERSTNPAVPPAGLFFHPSHCWAQLQQDGTCRIGFDALISRITGRVDDIFLPRAGERIHEGDAVVTITQGERTLSLISSMDGVVTEINGKLKPAMLKSRPYSDGWLFAISPNSLELETRRLLIGNEATTWYTKESQRIAEYFSSIPGLAKHLVYDSYTGSPNLGSIMEKASDAEWQQFQQQFFGAKSQQGPAA